MGSTALALRQTVRGSAAEDRNRSSILALFLCCALVLGLCAAGSPRQGTGRAYFPLAAGTVAVGLGGALVEVPDDSFNLVPGTRVLAGTADSQRYAAEQLSWLAEGEVPRVPELGDSTLVRHALLDLHVLSAGSGVAVAGWTPQWRYVWPRDSALVATALARTGHHTDAERVLSFLQRVQPEPGVFEARYHPDGTGVPDRRGPQADGIGWALWAMRQVAEQLPQGSRRAFIERHRSLLDRSTRSLLTMIDNPSSLPPPSSDYWEKKEQKLTLSTVALLHAGLVSASVLFATVGDGEQSRSAGEGAVRMAAAIRRDFAHEGYPRIVGGSPSSVDLGVSYLLPPFVDESDASVVEVWRASATRMARPAGGLAPGGSWRDDGVSWNTATSSYAMTAAFVDNRDAGLSWLRWLDAHRTRHGSLPEKVLHDGAPASVAPLAWAAAAVIIAADELAERSG